MHNIKARSCKCDLSTNIRPYEQRHCPSQQSYLVLGIEVSSFQSKVGLLISFVRSSVSCYYNYRFLQDLAFYELIANYLLRHSLLVTPPKDQMKHGIYPPSCSTQAPSTSPLVVWRLDLRRLLQLDDHSLCHPLHRSPRTDRCQTCNWRKTPLASMHEHETGYTHVCGSDNGHEIASL